MAGLTEEQTEKWLSPHVSQPDQSHHSVLKGVIKSELMKEKEENMQSLKDTMGHIVPAMLRNRLVFTLVGTMILLLPAVL